MIKSGNPLKNLRHADVVKYVVTIPPISVASCQFVAMNKKKWDSLPDSAKKVFDEVSLEWAEKQAMVWYYQDVITLNYFKGLQGKELIVIGQDQRAAWEEPNKSVVEKYIKEKKAMGLPAADYIEFVRKRVKYWAPKRPSPDACIRWVEDNVPKK